MSHVLFIAISLTWGLSFLLMKKGLLAFGPMGVASGRVITGALALVVIWKLRKMDWTLERHDWWPLVFVAIVGYAVPYALQPYVIGVVQESGGHGSAFGGLMVSLVPLLTILVSAPLLGVKASPRQWVGVLGGLFFMFGLFADELMHHGVPMMALVLGAVTPLCYAVSNTYVKRRFADRSALVVTGVCMAMTSVVLTPASAVVEGVNTTSDQFTLALVCVVILGVFATGIATYWFYVLIHWHGPLYAGMVTYVIPCVSLIVGFLDGETVTGWQLLALVGILAMVALVQANRPGSEPGSGAPVVTPPDGDDVAEKGTE